MSGESRNRCGPACLRDPATLSLAVYVSDSAGGRFWDSRVRGTAERIEENWTIFVRRSTVSTTRLGLLVRWIDIGRLVARAKGPDAVATLRPAGRRRWCGVVLPRRMSSCRTPRSTGSGGKFDRQHVDVGPRRSGCSG